MPRSLVILSFQKYDHNLRATDGGWLHAASVGALYSLASFPIYAIVKFHCMQILLVVDLVCVY